MLHGETLGYLPPLASTLALPLLLLRLGEFIAVILGCYKYFLSSEPLSTVPLILPLFWSEFDQERFILGIGREFTPLMYQVVCLEVSEFMIAFWASLLSLSLGVLDRIISVTVEVPRQYAGCLLLHAKPWTPYLQPIQQMLSGCLFSSGPLAYSVNNSPTRLSNHICSCHILLADSSARKCWFVGSPHHSISRMKGPGARTEWVAQYIIHLQRPFLSSNDHLSKLRTICFNDYFIACPYLSFHLLWEITKCLSFEVSNCVVEFHLRWVRLKPVMTKCLISSLAESLCLKHADHALSSSGVARLPVSRQTKACFSPLKHRHDQFYVFFVSFDHQRGIWRYKRDYWRYKPDY